MILANTSFKLAGLDIGIIVVYIIAMAVLGLWCRKKAAQGLDSYFLGGHKIPWWALSLSGSVSTFDITGTMWIVSLFFLMGIKSIWIHWMWGFLMAAFFMSYMGSWVRRSNVLTGAEWMEKRFGGDAGGTYARGASAILAVVTCVAFLAYATEGIGKFAAEYLPWSTTTCALMVVGATTVYTLVGGIYSVVLTDVIQAFLVLAASLIITIVAVTNIDPAVLAEKAPEGWFDLGFSWTLPQLGENHEYYFFGALIMVYVAKGLLLNAGGPQQIYDFQRFLSAKNPRDASKIGSLWSLFLCYRWSLAMGIAALAIAGMKETDAESILPRVLHTYLGPGLLGFVIAGFLAASMSTFSSTLNGGAAYIVNDFYKAFFRPRARQKELVVISYVMSFLIVAAGVLLRFLFVGDPNDPANSLSIGNIFNWIMMVLGGGVLIPNFLRWYWWRFNGWGYTVSVSITMVASFFFLNQPAYYSFPLFFGIGLLAAIGVSLLTPPTPMATLKDFYRATEPAGWWGPVLAEIRRETPDFKKSESFGIQMFNTAVAGIGIVALYLFPVYLVIKHWESMGICLGVLGVCVAVLYATWYLPMKKRAEYP